MGYILTFEEMIARRSLLATAAFAKLFGQEPAKLPNILLITCGNLGPHLGCYGYSSVATPALDAFAAQATRYEKAFAVSSIPAVSRAGLETGMWPVSTGMHMDGRAVLPEFIKRLPDALKAAGYWVAASQAPAGKPRFVWRRLDAVSPARIRLRDAAYERLVKTLKPELRGKGADAQLPPHFEDNDDSRLDWAHYNELIGLLDMQFSARLKEATPDWLVIFASEYGFALEEGNSAVYETGTRVPLLVRMPGQMTGAVSQRLVSLIDIAPTLLTAAGVRVPAYMQGQPLSSPQQRRFVYASMDRVRDRYEYVRSVREGRYRYVRNYSTGAEELYDTQTDPNEVTDIAKAEAAVVSRMREQLERWRAEVRDLGLMPDAELAVREAQWRTRYAAGRAPEFVALQTKLTELASTKSLDKIYAAFAEEESPLRYWACVKGKDTHRREIERLTRDSSGAVRVAAAQALGNTKALLRELKSPEEWVRYLALLALQTDGSAKAAIEEMLKTEKNRTVSAAASRILKGM
ncbi:sulfatase [Bryobacterales bacterium F-183]|nr:sulfatase [Bryobacterales bacterium F-183]